MKKTNYLSIIVLLTAIFAITGFNFEDSSFQENSREYILLFIGIAIVVIFSVFKFYKK